MRRALWRRGLRYRKNLANLPGRPDIVLVRDRVAIFVDGDFWHGRDLKLRLERLSVGHNASYWTAKIRANVARDLRNNRALTKAGWTVLRYWERDVAGDVESVANRIAGTLRALRDR